MKKEKEKEKEKKKEKKKKKTNPLHNRRPRGGEHRREDGLKRYIPTNTRVRKTTAARTEGMRTTATKQNFRKNKKKWAQKGSSFSLTRQSR